MQKDVRLSPFKKNYPDSLNENKLTFPMSVNVGAKLTNNFENCNIFFGLLHLQICTKIF